MLKGIFRGVINSVCCTGLGTIVGGVIVLWIMDKHGWIRYERIGDYYYKFSKKK